MDEERFWATIDAFDWAHEGDDDAVLRPATEALTAMPSEEIQAFKDLLAAKLYALDTREHARYAFWGRADPDDGDAYISADAFLYVRCVVVANGRAFYEAVLAEPPRMPSEMEFEALLWLADGAHIAKTGAETPSLTAVSWESFSNLEGWRPNQYTRPGSATSDRVPTMNRRPA